MEEGILQLEENVLLLLCIKDAYPKRKSKVYNRYIGNPRWDTLEYTRIRVVKNP